MRRVVSKMLTLLPDRQRQMAYRVHRGLFPGKRPLLAAKYLRGSGIEVGAMNRPLRVPLGVSVRYVDNVSRDDNLGRFPNFQSRDLALPDFIEDGFTLPSFAPGSVDFLIANHVLEHSDNVLKTLSRWADVQKPGGVLFITVPLAEFCFDRGRPITPLEHFVSDYELERSGRQDLFAELTLQHYAEWVAISEPAILGVPRPKSREEVRAKANQMQQERAEIHFHTFSTSSYQALLQHFCSEMCPDFRLLDLVANRDEAIGVLERAPT